MNQLASVRPSAAPSPSLLGSHSVAQVPIGGVIRPGIKVLTQSAQQNETARAIYERGCASGKDFDSIEREIRQAVPSLKSPLHPANVPYFSVRRSDFQMPELADQLLQKYGQVREDGVRRLYRFPVIFVADAWELLMPHHLQVWASGKRKYWAEYESNGARRCKTYAAVPRDSAGHVIRLFGGRKIIDRAEFDGRCEPEQCPQYQARQCNLDARLLFIVPGLPTVNLIALPTRSIYSMDGIRQQLLHVASMRGGRMSGYLLGQETFWISKVLKDVSRIDDSGEAVKGPAWLIELQAPIDISKLLAMHEPAMLAAAADAAVSVLESECAQSEAAPAVQAEFPECKQPSSNQEQDATRQMIKKLRCEVFAAFEQYGIDVDAFKGFATTCWRDDGWGRSPELLSQALALLRLVGPKLVRLRRLLQGMEVPIDRFRRYATRRFRHEHWQFQPEDVIRAIREVERYGQAPEALAALVEAELQSN